MRRTSKILRAVLYGTVRNILRSAKRCGLMILPFPNSDVRIALDARKMKKII